MENKIRLLKNGIFKDNIENPLLLNFDLSQVIKNLDIARENIDQDGT